MVMGLQSRNWVGKWLVLGSLAFWLGGCADCQDRALDRMEGSLRSDPLRSGKVGTLHALEVSQQAKLLADQIALRAEGPCDIGWTLDEAFSMRFDLEITVERGGWQRGWSEKGSWVRDDGGQWEIQNSAEFVDGDYAQGEREYRAFSGEDGFWEWLGPDSVARHPGSAPVELRWRREFGSRFAELMNLVSSGWIKTSERRWLPGNEFAACGPIHRGESASWQPLLAARAQRVQAEIELVEGEADERCRRIRAEYRIEQGGRLIVEFIECVGTPPEMLQRELAQEVVEVERSREGALISRELEGWIEAGIAEVVE